MVRKRSSLGAPSAVSIVLSFCVPRLGCACSRTAGGLRLSVQLTDVGREPASHSLCQSRRKQLVIFCMGEGLGRASGRHAPRQPATGRLVLYPHTRGLAPTRASLAQSGGRTRHHKMAARDPSASPSAATTTSLEAAIARDALGTHTCPQTSNQTVTVLTSAPWRAGAASNSTARATGAPFERHGDRGWGERPRP